MTNPLLKTISSYAEKALLYEVSLTPKRGLVDRYSNGAHHDMDFYTFLDSIVSLAPFFYQYAEAGYNHKGDAPLLFEQLRKIGKKAEKAMLHATNGINTHKGANFSFAILLGATGLYIKKGATLPFTKKDTESVLQIAKQIVSGIVEKDFQHLSCKDKESLTYGEKLYLEHGSTGIRGEAASGYPTLNKLLDFLRQHTQNNQEIKYLYALIFLMSETQDSNLLHRGGFEALKQVQAESSYLFKKNLSAQAFIHELTIYDLHLTKRHLSPGGSADLLALSIYFSFLEHSLSPSGKNV